jgi:5-methyltetrahydrofolate--homocysteine methyltransferase
MVHVAREMKRRHMSMPLLIGGATTSRQHTAVKIAPEYDGPAVHVLDASRAVGTVSALVDPKRRDAYWSEARKDQEQLRALFAHKRGRPLLAYPIANERRVELAFGPEQAKAPSLRGRAALHDIALPDIVPYIDWTFFFTAWELVGRFPAILDDPRHGAAARELYDDGRRLLERIVRDRSLVARAAYGIWPAYSEGNDIVLTRVDVPDGEITRFPMLRQQEERAERSTFACLADFVAPRLVGGARVGPRSVPLVDTDPRDWVGAFVVTAGIGAEALASSFEKSLDDYHAIMSKALADRLAEALAELVHMRLRRAWYAPDEALSADDLIAERYRGIRPAFGYPACPDHSVKTALFDLLGAADIGVSLTEHGAMLPAASVSGLVLGHPEARYFNVGRVGRDQVADYARRRGMSVDEVERWLAPNLAYEPIQ